MYRCAHGAMISPTSQGCALLNSAHPPFHTHAAFPVPHRFTLHPQPMAPHIPEPAAPEGASRVLPLDIWMHVLGYCGPSDLTVVSRLCRSLHAQATHNVLWEQLCQWRWAQKQPSPARRVGQLFPRGCYCHCTAQLTVAETKRLLHQRRAWPPAMQPAPIEKHELCALLLTTCPVGQHLCIRSKWMASFAHAELDGRRQRITVPEVAEV